MFHRIVGATVALLCLISASAWSQTAPPQAVPKPHTYTIHGATIHDPYFYLRHKKDPQVLDYLKAENSYTDAMMAETKPWQETFFQELKARIPAADHTAPEKQGDYYYYQRTEAHLPYPIYCRRQGSMQAKEDILLDLNHVAKGHAFLSLGVFKISPDQRYLAYSLDFNGSEAFNLYIKDLHTGQTLADMIPQTYYTAEWANDNKTLLYTTIDHANRSFKLHRHVLGSNPKQDVMLYHEPDEAFNVDIYKTKSQAYLMLVIASLTTSEVHVLDASKPTSLFQIMQPRQAGVMYSAQHRDEEFYIMTDEQAPNMKIMKAPRTAPQKKNWQEVLAHRPAVKLESMELFQNHLVVHERTNGLKQIRVRNLQTNQDSLVPFTEATYEIWSKDTPAFNSPTIRYGYSSLVTPISYYDYDLATGKSVLIKQKAIGGTYDANQYQSERIYAKAQDGTLVPISLVYKKGLTKNGTHPLLLNGYGAYGSSGETIFSADLLPWLDRGGIFALAHIRGGLDMGRAWHEQGKLMHKKNSFTDFIACAEHLIAQKYTAPASLAIMGRSAGGLLMGAVTNLRPDLFRAVIAGVPFVDVMNTMLDPSLPLTVIEYEEWGNPNDKAAYDYMRSYSPYDNVRATAYPNMLVTAGLNDPRVGYWEPAKWVARLRTKKTDKNLLLLKTDMRAGHSGASDRLEEIKELAFEYAFLFKVMGSKP